MTSARTRPQPVVTEERITGPMRVLIESGATSRELAREMHISQSTAARRIREFREIRQQAFRKQTLVMAMYVTLTICAVVLAAAVATLAWG